MARFKTDLLPFQIALAASSASIAGIIAVLGELRDVMGFSEMAIGVVVAAGFLGSFIAQIWFSRFADVGYGRQMVTVGIAVAALALFVMVFADDLWLWIVSRGVLGFASGLTVPGLKRAAAVLDPKKVGENLGRLVVGDMTGFLLGPVGAAVLAEYVGFRAPFLVLSIGLVLFLPFAARLPADQGQLDESGRKNSFDLLRIRRLQGALLLVLGYFCLIGAWESVMPVMFADRGGGPLATGIAFTLLGIPMIMFSTTAGRTADRVGPPLVAAGSLTIIAISTMFYGFINPIPVLVGFQGLMGVADAFGFTANQVAVSRAVPEDRQAAALGLMGSVQVLGAGLFAFPAAALYQSTDEETTWVVVGAVMLVIIGLGVARLRGTAPATSAEATQASLHA
ncbi:MAG: MFS transporter [Acidimicrobiales bacterium]|nr:MFS transporter [Acidimicrobiales bacterium]